MAYNPNGQVVENATALSDQLDGLTELGSGAQDLLAATVARIVALENPPVQPRAFFSDPFFSDPFFTRA